MQSPQLEPRLAKPVRQVMVRIARLVTAMQHLPLPTALLRQFLPVVMFQVRPIR